MNLKKSLALLCFLGVFGLSAMQKPPSRETLQRSFPQEELATVLFSNGATVTTPQELLEALAKGASPDVRFPESPHRTLLMYFTDYGDSSIANALIDSHAQLDLADDLGNTALFYAVEAGNLPLVARLLKDGAKATILNKKGENALMFALSEAQNFSRFKKARFHKNIIEITKLLKDKININQQSIPSAVGQTALMLAAALRRLDLVKLLQGLGGNVCIRDQFGRMLDEYLPNQAIKHFLPGEMDFSQQEPIVPYKMLSDEYKNYVLFLKELIKNKCVSKEMKRLRFSGATVLTGCTREEKQ